jgi:hypothetical protein
MMKSDCTGPAAGQICCAMIGGAAGVSTACQAGPCSIAQPCSTDGECFTMGQTCNSMMFMGITVHTCGAAQPRDGGGDAPKGDAPAGDAPTGDAPTGDAPASDAAGG